MESNKKSNLSELAECLNKSNAELQEFMLFCIIFSVASLFGSIVTYVVGWKYFWILISISVLFSIHWIVAAALDLISGIWSIIKRTKHQISGRKFHLKGIDPKKISPYSCIDMKESTLQNIENWLILEICESIFTNQLGRKLFDSIFSTETIDILETIRSSEKESVVVISRYCQHLKTISNGVTRTSVNASVHVFQMRINHIAKCVTPEHLISFDSKDFDCLPNARQELIGMVERIL